MRIATWMRESDLKYFPPLFSHFPDVILLDGRTESFDLNNVDALLLTGGGDVSPKYLKQTVDNPSILDCVNESRDEWEFPAFKTCFERGIPILAICRGMQLMNVALDGTLHLDIQGHNLPEQKNENCQPLQYAHRRSIVFEKVNSSHHQAINRLGSNLHIEAWHKEDQIIEQIRVQGYPFALGTQYHPERHSDYIPLFKIFIQEIKRSLSQS